ncbi:NUDIX hydrolase [Streptomyces sp. BE20]|uniref:NUDIX hydrolase n=1 Tax=Streptomyces sp. BE20 TaxID=3002525 RepID=UPI002E78BE05|nr:NUDIX hydrolase [Streptomyces sp. BE20]MEE1822638.1 NUDIX hydrolase [Streptomyces sp. BE20]
MTSLPRILTDPPGRRLGHQALILNRDGAVLLIGTAYKNGLMLPGGSAERNELPHLAARRHTETETGLALPLARVLAVDYVSMQLLPEGVNFVYWGGRLVPTQEEIVRRHRPPAEIVELRWAHRAELGDLMEADQHRRLEQALDALGRGAHLPMLLRGVPAA